jgi:hypothetical protein
VVARGRRVKDDRKQNTSALLAEPKNTEKREGLKGIEGKVILFTRKVSLLNREMTESLQTYSYITGSRPSYDYEHDP